MKNNVKRYLGVCLILLLVACAGPAKKPLLEPKIHVRSLEVVDATLSGIDAIVTLDVDNPNEVKLSANGLSYELFVSDRQLISGQDDKPITVPAFGRETIQLPMRLSYIGLIETLPEVLQSGKANYTVKGSIKTTIFNYAIPFSKQGEFKLPLK